ncbi:DEAD/DEAH box helicase, partial [Methylobacterium sp. WL9]
AVERTERPPAERPRERESRRPTPRRDEDGDTPVGLGSHVPAFLMRPVPPKKD